MGCGVGMDGDAGRGFRGVLVGGGGGHSLSLVWGDGGEGVGGAGWGGVTHCRWLRSSSIVFVPAMKTRSLQFCHCDFVDRM